jgi:son of sevenless-like protein
VATLFCRALYDYEAQDASTLSFRKNDIIKVLTKQPSGWWDGLLGDERGWLPSNYVAVISNEEAEVPFSNSTELSIPDHQTDNIDATNAEIDLSHAMMRGTTEEWLNAEIDNLQGGMEELALAKPFESSDFWMPEVTSDGQVSIRLDLI